MTAKHRALIAAAKRARARAYCPYSGFAVGAVVLGGSGRVYSGANVENSAVGLTVCAERIAIFKAVSQGERTIKAVCVACPGARPCGSCRQVMMEFSTKDTVILCVDLSGDGRQRSVEQARVFELLPDLTSRGIRAASSSDRGRWAKIRKRG